MFFYCKILVIQEGLYQEIVVEDLNRDVTDDLKYVTVVKVPNWDSNKFELNDVGYLQFQCVEGGKTPWFNKSIKEFEVYQYDNNYFINFFKEQEKYNQKKFKF